MKYKIFLLSGISIVFALIFYLSGFHPLLIIIWMGGLFMYSSYCVEEVFIFSGKAIDIHIKQLEKIRELLDKSKKVMDEHKKLYLANAKKNKR